MKVVFRVDASLQIGTGHVMRCLTLANALRESGAQCHFICREHDGNLLDRIKSQGFTATSLPASEEAFQPTPVNGERLPVHAAWLGCDWRDDADATREVLQSEKPGWLIVDHYALDQAWERALRDDYHKLMVIDDLADRSHCCDLILDQNLGHEAADYAELVPLTCTILIGPKYALLRPEFAKLREYSLRRRQRPTLQQVLVTMGGVDSADATGQVLDVLECCPLPSDSRITVVMGAQAPWLASVREKAAAMPQPCEVRVDVEEMAQLMADSDLAIGAAGSTSWERCCLGLPSILLVLAENQRDIALALNEADAAITLLCHNAHIQRDKVSKAVERLSDDAIMLSRLGEAAARVTDGAGVSRILPHVSADA